MMKLSVVGILLIFLFVIYSSTKSIETYIGQLRVVTDLDEKRAIKYALREICKKGGYQWFDSEKDEFLYDCRHTKETCLNESIYPTPTGKTPKYQEWRSIGSPDAQEIQKREHNTIQAPDGYCIMGNEEFRKTCEKESLAYNRDTGDCRTTRTYCNNRLLPFCRVEGEYDCFENPLASAFSKMVGNTLSRSVYKGLGYTDAINEICKNV